MMTVSAFGSSIAQPSPVVVLTSGYKLAAVTDVNSRYLLFFLSDHLAILLRSLGFKNANKANQACLADYLLH